MRVNNNFSALGISNSNNVQQRKASPSFGMMTNVADDFIKINGMFKNFHDKTAYQSLKTDPYVMLDFLPKAQRFQLNWSHSNNVPKGKLMDIYSKKGFEIPVFSDITQALTDVYHAMTFATREQKIERLKNLRVKPTSILNDIKKEESHLIKWKARYSDDELASKNEVYEAAIAEFKENHH